MEGVLGEILHQPELTDPYFDMYGGMIPAAAVAARQRWGSRDIFIPETESFNGPEILPESIADSLKDINYGEIPYEEMPDELRDDWKELLDNLATYPIDGEKDSLFGLGTGTWAASRKPAATGIKNVEQVWATDAY